MGSVVGEGWNVFVVVLFQVEGANASLDCIDAFQADKTHRSLSSPSIW